MSILQNKHNTEDIKTNLPASINLVRL